MRERIIGSIETFPSSALAREPILVPLPSAGSDWSQAAAGQGWLVKAVSAQIVQGATQTPLPVLQIADAAGNVLFESFGSSNAMTASTTARFTWAPGLTLSSLVGVSPAIHAVAPLPHDCFIGPGWQIKTVTLGIGGNTQYENVAIWVVQSG